MNTNTIITDENDIFVYFQIIQQIQPASILDIGLFLQRIGAVSRQAMSCEIPKTTYLEGIELFDQNTLPIYSKVYDKITRLPEYPFSEDKTYDMVICMRVNEWLHPDDRLFFWQYITTHAHAIISDTADAEFVNYVISHCNAEAINVDGQQYALIHGDIPQS